MAGDRVRESEAASAVIASYGFSRTTIYKWLAAASKPGVVLPRVEPLWPAAATPYTFHVASDAA